MYTKMLCKREFTMKLFDDPRLSGKSPNSNTVIQLLVGWKFEGN